ncbi:chemotaxis protein CheV [Tissierella pigra]|uniref:Chemotaxis protein CheV n=1 Tax=Tissierella pigra TaxID=2607614 RepID=A0A6N7Y1Z7_9FIRM|nr:chemotaxis protein [Tissierella pigra]MSU02040.1 chemotaxis protein CheV [Tissierella pigra]
MSKEILLESGTNELEIVVFNVGESILGVNVAKVESIIETLPITDVPNAHKNVKGVINYRGRVIPVINMLKALSKECQDPNEPRLLILIHINNNDFAIEVSGVEGIKRLSWQDIESPSHILISDNETPTTGVVKDNERIILMLDFEKILADIDPSLSLKESSRTRGLEGKKIVVAEDSVFLIKIVNESFIKAGAIVEKFSNGKLALDYLRQVSEDEVYCVITDIEMPVMDGLTLTREIKTNERLKSIPVILFSSIVSENLKHRGLSVGADGQITKPEIDKLISMVMEIGSQRNIKK